MPVIVDSTADLTDAAAKIAASKTFDNATSCSSENALIILDDVYDATIAALEDAGGYLAAGPDGARVAAMLFPDGRLDRNYIAKDAPVLIEAFGLDAPPATRFVMVEEPAPAADRPLTGEKLSLVLTVYRARDFADATDIVRRVLAQHYRPDPGSGGPSWLRPHEG